MVISVLALDDSPVRLWFLTARERLRRQLRALGRFEWIERIEALPDRGRVLLLNAAHLFGNRVLQAVLERPEAVLLAEPGGRAVAALVPASRARDLVAAIGPQAAAPPPDLPHLYPQQFESFDETLRSARPPLLEPVSPERKDALENLLYGDAYRGITDLVTKFVWPRPARRAVRACARWGLSPNAVTTVGFVLMLAACWLFWQRYYFGGLGAGWLMTFLDTVDGKLARVTVQSSRFGHYFDHAIDLLHPPFWYILWGASLDPAPRAAGMDFRAQCIVLIVAYVTGRLAEGLFPLLGRCSLFTWRPFDAWFRLVTARRNPCLILLSLGALAGHADWGFVAVVGWSALSTSVLLLRLLQGTVGRIRTGPLESWLGAAGVADGPHARSFRIFGGTRGAYAG